MPLFLFKTCSPSILGRYSVFRPLTGLAAGAYCKILTHDIIKNSHEHQGHTNPKPPVMMHPLPVKRLIIVNLVLVLPRYPAVLMLIFIHVLSSKLLCSSPP